MREKLDVKTALIIATVTAISYFIGYFSRTEPKVIFQVTTRPSQVLQFKPVCESSDPNDIRIAQAELCRHGIDCKIDGKCGEETAQGMCDFLVRLENGYEQFKYYERNPNRTTGEKTGSEFVE